MSKCKVRTSQTILPFLVLLLKIILHPKWGSSVYPASMFVKAPVEVVLAAIKAAEAELAEQLA
jgi:hypothetical protein